MPAPDPKRQPGRNPAQEPVRPSGRNQRPGNRQVDPRPKSGDGEPRGMHPETGELYTQAQCERAIHRITIAMEELVSDLIPAANARAAAEHAYKRKYAKVHLKAKAAPGNGPGGRTTDAEAEDAAIEACDEELLARLTTAAMWDAIEEKSRLMRAALDALRTVAANIRSQT